MGERQEVIRRLLGPITRRHPHPPEGMLASGSLNAPRKAPGHCGGTWVNLDIAFPFGSWLGPEFKLCPKIDFHQRLQSDGIAP